MSKRFEFIKARQRSPQWFALRKDAITATDIAVISGLSPYKTPFRLFAEKSGKVMEQAAGAAADRGRLLEDAVAKYYEQERKVKLRQSNGVVRLKAHPWAMASLDRTIVGEPDGIVEIKTSTSRAWDLQPIPPFVAAQVQWQLFCTGAQWCDVVALLGGLIFRIVRVEADPIYHTQLFERAVAFREALVKGEMPSMMAADSATFEEMTPQRLSDMAVAEGDLNRIGQRYADCAYEIKLLEEELATHAIAIKECIGEKEGIIGDGWSASWKQNKPSRKVDWQRLAVEEKIAPDTVNAYTLETPGARVFRFKQKEVAND